MQSGFGGTWCRAVLLLPVFVAGCAHTQSGKGQAAPAPPGPEKLQTARMAVQAAEAQVRIGEADLELQKQANEARLAQLASELKVAKIKLGQLQTIEVKKRVDEAELAVTHVNDAIEDAEDELKQLEEMYQGNELADATKEIVLKRGRRNVERSRRELALQRLRLEILKDHEIPAEVEKLATDVDQKKAELERETRNAANQLAQKQNAVLRARIDLEKAQQELAELEKQAAPAGSQKSGS